MVMCLSASLGVRDTVCYLHELTFSDFQPFIAQNYWADFNQDSLQSRYVMYQI